MIGTIQRNIKKLSFVLWIIVAAFVGTIFLVWGRGAFNIGINYLAKVGDVEISPLEFQKTYMRIIDFYRNMMKGKFTEDMIKTLHIKEQALNTLINRALILYAAKKEGIIVAPIEVAETIQSIDAFKVGGVFNKDRYVRVLRLNGYSPVEFERDLYQDILRKKLELTVKLSVRLDDVEAEKFAQWMLEKGKIKYITASVLDFAPMVHIEEDKLREFYKKNIELFRTGPKISFDYIEVSPDKFEKRILVTDEEIKEYYHRHQDEFVDKNGNLLPLTKVREKVIKMVKREKARKEALRALKRFRNDVLKQDNFEVLAKKYGFKVVKVSLKEKSKLNLPEFVINKLFSLNTGDVSDVIKAEDKFYIFKVNEKVPSQIPPFEEIRWKVEQAYREAHAVEAAERWANNLVKSIKKGDLTSVVKNLGLKYKVKTSGFFTREGIKIDGITYRNLAMRALDLKKKEAGFVIEGGKLFVFVLTEKIKPSKKELLTVLKDLKLRLLDRKREAVWNQFLSDLRERVEIKINRRIWESIR